MRRFAKWVYRAFRYGPRAASAIGRLHRKIRRNETRIRELQEKFRRAADNPELQRLYALDEQEALERIQKYNQEINELMN